MVACACRKGVKQISEGTDLKEEEGRRYLNRRALSLVGKFLSRKHKQVHERLRTCQRRQ